MLELHEDRTRTYVPLSGRPPLPTPPNRAFTAIADDGARFDVFVVGSLFVPGPWMLELRVHGAELADPERPNVTLCELARWPTFDELFTIVDQAFPRGMPVMIPFVSNGPAHTYPAIEPGEPRQLFLNGIAMQQAQPRPGPQLVGGRA